MRGGALLDGRDRPAYGPPVSAEVAALLREKRAPFRKVGWWLGAQVPELGFFVLGVLLRLSMLRRFDPSWGYDAGVYWDVVEWVAAHGSPFPPLDQLVCAHHPPLFFAVAAYLTKHGVTRAHVTYFPVACGIVRLAILWMGLRWYLPAWRWARVFALAVAAVLPVSVHIDGSLYPEPVNGMFAAGVLLLVPKVFPARGWRRWVLAAAVGVLVGFQLLTKITALAMILTLGLTLALELWFERPRGMAAYKATLRRLAPWSAVIVVPVLMSGWYFARNVRTYHKVFVTGYDTTAKDLVTPALLKTSLLDRRTVGFYVGWDNDIFRMPYYPTGLGDHPRFLTTTIASTFVDYYNQSFSGLDPDAPGLKVIRRSMTSQFVSTARFSMVGGTVLSIATVLAWLVCTRRMIARRDIESAYLLLVPLVMTVLALYTAVEYPFDGNGVIKGAYMQFGAPPLCGVCGLAFDWTLRRRYSWPLAALLVLSVVLVAAYTIHCRTGVLLLPALGRWYTPG